MRFGGWVWCVGLVTGAAAAQTMPPWQMGPWTRPVDAPVIRPQPASVFADPMSGKAVHWEALHTFNPAAVVRDGKVMLLYRAEDDQGTMKIGGHTSRLGLAESTDGVHFARVPGGPVLYPADDEQRTREWTGGVEDPRVVEAEDGSYVLTYTQWSPEHDHYTIGIATSRDLRTWVKHGPALAGSAGGRYDALKYKSGAIVTRLVPGSGGAGPRLVAARIRGKFWMFWGEIEVRLAVSDDLIHWTPVERDGAPLVVLRARPGKADSGFPEVGPPPVLTRRGITVLYNAKNAEGAGGDRRLAAGTCSVEEALFSADDPTRLLERTEEPVFQPELPFERSGQYAAGTTFAEGLVWFGGRWLMYYGCADSLVGAAAAPGERH